MTKIISAITTAVVSSTHGTNDARLVCTVAYQSSEELLLKMAPADTSNNATLNLRHIKLLFILGIIMKVNNKQKNVE